MSLKKLLQTFAIITLISLLPKCSGSSSTNETEVHAINGGKILFITDSTFNGNLGGISGADDLCNSDANKPNSSTYKAMIVADSPARRACTHPDCSNSGASEHFDWVLSPNTEYYRDDGTTLIGTTNSAGIFSFPLDNTYLLTEGSNDVERIWTGISDDWINDYECSSWTVSTPGGFPNIGGHARIDATDSQAIRYSTQRCSEFSHLACVEQ